MSIQEQAEDAANKLRADGFKLINPQPGYWVMKYPGSRESIWVTDENIIDELPE